MELEEKKPKTEEERFKMHLQAEAELAQLQRHYAIAARGRAEFSEEISTQYQKQKHVLTIWQKEHNELQLDLLVANNPTKRKADRKVLNQLQSLLDEYAAFGEKISAKRAHANEINDQIKMVKKDIVDLKSNIVTHSQCDERLWIGMQHLETLENKLEVQVKKFCGIRAQNCEMREQIDHMLKERQNFMKTWNTVIRHLLLGKQFMLDLIEQASIAYDQREEWCSKLQALRAKVHADLLVQNQEMNEGVCRRDNNEKFEAFLQIKGQKRVMRDLQTKRMEDRKKRYESLEEIRIKYENFKNEILEFNAESDVKTIVTTYKHCEANNFTLFNRVNDLNQDMEQLNDQLLNLYSKIDEEKRLMEQRRQYQEGKLSTLKNLLTGTISKRQIKEAQLAQTNSELDVILSGVDALFKLCRCDTDPLLQLLGNFSSINRYNVLMFQLILEEKVQELILYAYHRDKIKRLKPGERLINEEGTGVKYFIQDIVPSNPCPLCVEHEQVSDVIDVVQKVWSRNEAKHKLAQRLALKDGHLRVHNVSACHLPKSRDIIQKRYQ